MDELPTSDLYRAGFLYCRGFKLKRLTVKGTDGRKIATFVMTGQGIRRVNDQYETSAVNVPMLKAALTDLKDALFARIREVERAERRERWQNRESTSRP